MYICRTSEESIRHGAVTYALQALLGTAFIAIFIALLVLHWRISSSVARFERRLSSMRRGSAQSDATHITASMFRIFATITVIFVVSYLPHLVCLVVEKALFPPEEPMPQAVRVLMDLAYNFPYINVVCQPLHLRATAASSSDSTAWSCSGTSVAVAAAAAAAAVGNTIGSGCVKSRACRCGRGWLYGKPSMSLQWQYYQRGVRLCLCSGNTISME